MKRIVFGSLVAALLWVTMGCGAGSGNEATNAQGVPKTLRVGLIPNISPDEQRARYMPFGKYLEKQLGVKVELFVATDYAGVVEALASNHIDIAYVGGLTYAQAEQQVKLTPMVTELDRETGQREYESAIVVPKDSRITSVGDLLAAKASFAFGDVSSTSGSLYPRIMLVEAGAKCSAERLTECPPLTKMSFTGGHDAAAQAVLAGAADAGGLELRILHRLEREGSVPPGALRVIATKRVMGYPWVARTELGTSAIATISEQFLQMRDASLLELMRAKGYAKVTAADYDEVRNRAQQLGLVNTAQ